MEGKSRLGSPAKWRCLRRPRQTNAREASELLGLGLAVFLGITVVEMHHMAVLTNEKEYSADLTKNASKLNDFLTTWDATGKDLSVVAKRLNQLVATNEGDLQPTLANLREVVQKFNNTLDGLILVDLTKTEPKLLDRYLGKAEAAAILAFQKGNHGTH